VKDQDKTKMQLMTELAELRRQLAHLAPQQPEPVTPPIRLREELFHQVVLSISDHIYVTEITKEGQRLNLYISPHAADLTGYPLQNFIQDWSFWPSRVIHPDDRAAAAAQAAQLAKGYNSEVEYRMIRADGEIIWVRDSGKVRHHQQNGSRIIYGVVSDITERKRLEAQLLAIYQLGTELNLLRSEKKIFEKVLETIARVLQANHASYALVNHRLNRLEYCKQLVDGVLKPLHVDLPLSQIENIGVAVVQQGQAINVSDTAQHTVDTSAAFPGQHGRSRLCVPIKITDEIIGVLSLESALPHRFTPNDQQVLQTLADQAATAIENARLYKEIGQHIEELASMNMISQAITSSLDIGETLIVITNHVVRLFNARSAALALYDKAKDEIWFDAISGDRVGLTKGDRISSGEGVVGWVIQHGEPLLLADMAQDNRFYGDVEEQLQLKDHSILCFPLQTRSETIGAIEVISKKDELFNQNDLRLLSWLAMPAAVAIQNAQLFEQVSIGRKRLQSLSHRLVQIQETERRHIARELHDEAGQTLASLMVGLRLLEKEANNPKAIPIRIAELKRTTDGVLENLHRLAMDLHPATLDHLGLVATLRQYVETFGAQYQLILQFETVGFDNEQRLPPTIETNLYRIVQEALSNVARHAQATHADVLLERRGGQIVTIIEDNGIGFDPETKKASNRLGLLGMRERAEMMGGRLEIESAPGAGTTIYVETPYASSYSHS
jgi:PAS domain S-box-containing protein